MEVTSAHTGSVSNARIPPTKGIVAAARMKRYTASSAASLCPRQGEDCFVQRRVRDAKHTEWRRVHHPIFASIFAVGAEANQTATPTAATPSPTCS